MYVISLATYLLHNVIKYYISDSLWPNVSVSVTSIAMYRMIDVILMYLSLFVLFSVCLRDLAGNVSAA